MGSEYSDIDTWGTLYLVLTALILFTNFKGQLLGIWQIFWFHCVHPAWFPPDKGFLERYS